MTLLMKNAPVGSPAPGLSDSPLWARIRGAHLPVSCDGQAFHERLGQIAGLVAAEAQKLEDEYRRFLYLAMLSEAPRRPPRLIRVAWAYHAGLAGYTEDFCPWVLGRDLRPTRSARPQDQGYAQSWAAYRDEFLRPPPVEFWPVPATA